MNKQHLLVCLNLESTLQNRGDVSYSEWPWISSPNHTISSSVDFYVIFNTLIAYFNHAFNLALFAEYINVFSSDFNV